MNDCREEPLPDGGKRLIWTLPSIPVEGSSGYVDPGPQEIIIEIAADGSVKVNGDAVQVNQES